LHWVDVFAGAVYSLDPTGDGVPRRFEHGAELGALARVPAAGSSSPPAAPWSQPTSTAAGP
jgi:hypothetical protein